jgi:hypothetical protein
MSPFRKQNRDFEELHDDLQGGSLFLGTISSDNVENDRVGDNDIGDRTTTYESRLESSRDTAFDVECPVYGDMSAMVVSIGSDGEESNDEYVW